MSVDSRLLNYFRDEWCFSASYSPHTYCTRLYVSDSWSFTFEDTYVRILLACTTNDIIINLFLSSLCSIWLLRRKFYTCMNLASVCPNTTKPVSGRSPSGAPITETKFPIATPASANLLIHCLWHHWSLTPYEVQYPTPLILRPQQNPFPNAI